jgi:hypothetical protein
MNKYYAVLGLPSTASKDEVRRRYRKLVLLWHPDKNPSPEAHGKFIAITEAYDVLMGERPAPRVTYRGYSAPKPKTPFEQRQEKRKTKADLFRNKFERIRLEHRSGREAENRKMQMYRKAKLYFAGAGLMTVAAVVLPIVLGGPGYMSVTLPVSLPLGLQMVWRGGRFKLRADMIFGDQKFFTDEEISEFFIDGIGFRSSSSDDSGGYF